MNSLDRLTVARPKVLVVGDIILDHYRIAEASRISPEAPVPVLLNPRAEFRLGGAAAVAAMCAALGAEVVLIGTIGNDPSGQQVKELLIESGIIFAGVVTPGRVTTTKERICGVASGRHRQQLVRVDCEDERPLPDEAHDVLCETLQGIGKDPPDVLLVADYAKGVVTRDIAALCRAACNLTIADPPRAGSWRKYRQFGCIVPNREEAGGRTVHQIRSYLNTQAAIVKLDQDGCEVDDGELHSGIVGIPARTRSVHDVTGAGDQFVAVLGCARSCGNSWIEAARLANVAAGMQVERHGCIPVTLDQLLQEVSHGSDGANSGLGASELPRSLLAAAG